MSGNGVGGGDPPFEIGLALAGAVSAGAYIAGVLDFFFQALEAWDKDKPVAPVRPVRLSLIAGASGGGIAGTVAALALSAGVKLPKPMESVADFVALPHLYDVWVKRPKLFDRDAGNDLLSTTDLEDGQVVSLLDGSLLDAIRDHALAIQPDANFKPRYLAEDLHIVLTLTNLRGVPYSLEFRNPAGASQCYVMVDHADRQHFILEKLGGGSKAPADLIGSYKPTVLPVANLPAVAPLAGDWKLLGEAVLGTGAFPIGLPARRIDKPDPDKRYPAELRPGLGTPHTIKPDWKNGGVKPDPTITYSFWASDGGVIDNEPFGIVDLTLEKALTRSHFATILVDPFVEPPNLSTFDPKGGGLAAAVAGQLVNALIDQARLRPDQVFEAQQNPGRQDERFLINPDRGETHHVAGSHLASGGLGGFAGFIDEAFRQHDYELGRRNCQRFLETKFVYAASATGGPPLPIIPLRGSAKIEIPRPRWPKISITVMDLFRDRLEGRATALVKTFSEGNTTKVYMRTLVGVAWRFLRGSLLDMVRDTVLIDLVRRDQIAELDLTANERAVLCCLIEPAWDFRTAAGIEKETGIGIGAVQSALVALKRREDRFQAVEGSKHGGAETYRVRYRKPAWLSSIPLLGQWLAKPTVN